MNDVTKILAEVQAGDSAAADRLLPLVYAELRQLASARLVQEQPGQTLQATALVHEAYLRLAGEKQPAVWQGRRHFFAAAAEAMRRILIEQARRKNRTKHGGSLQRQEIRDDLMVGSHKADSSEMLSVHEALDDLAAHSPRKAELVKLRYFLGCSVKESAEILQIAVATAEDDWRFAKAWLRRHLGQNSEK